MTIKHHLSDTTLGAFTAGTLMESISLVVASHLSLCRVCQAKHNQLEYIGGMHLLQGPTSTLSDGFLQKTLLRLGNQEIASSQIHANSNLHVNDTFPAPLREFVPTELKNIEWNSLAPGIKGHPLTELNTGNGTLSLLKISPGMSIPDHSHQGTELTLVLKGSFSDKIGQFGVGDIADLDDSTKHQPIADTSEACICLIATDASLKFTGLMPRLVQYFTGL
jgi:putative transcriptional regulator